MKPILLTAGLRDVQNCPVTFFFESDDQLCDRSFYLVNGKEKIPAQLSKDKNGKYRIDFIVSYMEKGTSYTLVPDFDTVPDLRMQSSEEKGKIDIKIDGNFYTAYQYDIGFAKPHIGPITTKNGENITRYDFEIKEHPHHRSIWFSHGSVNGIDTWNEPAGVHGFIKNQSAKAIAGGAVTTGFDAVNTWTDHSGNPLCDDRTTVRFYNPIGEFVIIDMELSLFANYGDVTLGATKEAGPVAVRMNENLRADRTGTMENSYGGINEGEIWMKRSFYCDYYGKTNDGYTYGVALLDNPENDSYPSYWHSRDYGLFAPNNFYLGGDRVIKSGESMTFKYRCIIHRGTTRDAGIQDQFNYYVSPPVCKFID